jgi:hypothetical protein
MSFLLKMTAFWAKAPCSLVKADRRFGGEYGLHQQWRWRKNGALMMDAVLTSETSVYFNETTQRYVPQKAVMLTPAAVRTWDPTQCYRQQGTQVSSNTVQQQQQLPGSITVRHVEQQWCWFILVQDWHKTQLSGITWVQESARRNNHPMIRMEQRRSWRGVKDACLSVCGFRGASVSKAICVYIPEVPKLLQFVPP